ncbi:MAG: ABC transporter permease, partial [Endomicrobiia bacterium]|nr:ABC transporter permease [Endomicrobiia bacterium]
AFVFAGIIFGRFFHFFSSVFTDFLKHEQHRGTMEHLMCAPTAFSSTAYAAAAAKLPRFAVEITALAWTGFALGLRFRPTDIAGVAALCVITAAGFAATGIFFAGLALDIKRSEQAGWLFSSLVEILSGVYFPATRLPGAVGWISSHLPTTALLDMWRGALSGNAPRFGNLLLAGATAILMIFAADAYFRRALRGAARRGDVSIY